MFLEQVVEFLWEEFVGHPGDACRLHVRPQYRDRHPQRLLTVLFGGTNVIWRMVFVNRGLFSIAVVAALAWSWPAMAQPSPNQADMSIDAKTRADTIASLAKGLRDAYVFPAVAEKLAVSLQQRHARGEYDSVTSAKAFSDLLTQQMLDFTHDRHLRLIYSAQTLPQLPVSKPGETPPPSARMLAQLRISNYEFERVERLAGNIGYLKLNGFVDAERGGAVAAGAMAFLANSDGLVIDLRQNTGGEPSMVALLASYFFSGTVHLYDLAYRIEGTKDEDVTQVWTAPYVPGQRYLDKEVYILTSPRTFSAAEEFTYDLHAVKRATIVGETTAGGANPGGPYRLGDHFYAGIPRGRSINPVTKTNWEGTGIEPDVRTPEQDALKIAHRMALQHLIEHTTDQQRLTSLRQALTTLESQR